MRIPDSLGCLTLATMLLGEDDRLARSIRSSLPSSVLRDRPLRLRVPVVASHPTELELPTLLEMMPAPRAAIAALCGARSCPIVGNAAAVLPALPPHTSAPLTQAEAPLPLFPLFPLLPQLGLMTHPASALEILSGWQTALLHA